MHFEVEPKGLAARLDVRSEREQNQDFWPEGGEGGGSFLASWLQKSESSDSRVLIYA